MQRDNPLFGKYRLECTWPGCSGKLQVVQAASAGLKLGDVVPADPSDHNYARCPRCKRCKMRVVEVPQYPTPKTDTGFTKIPTR